MVPVGSVAMRRPLLAVLLLLASCLPLAQAPAQTVRDARTTGAVVAAAPGVELVAGDTPRRTRLCLELEVAGVLGGRRCGLQAPERAALILVGFDVTSGRSIALENEDRVAGVAAPGGVERVALRFAGGAIREAQTVAGGSYRGAHAGTVRFAVLTGLPAERLVRVVGLSAGGAVLAAADLGERPASSRPVALVGSGDARLRARVVTRLAPTVVDARHRERMLCLRHGERAEDCDELQEQSPFGTIAYVTSCPPARRALVPS